MDAAVLQLTHLIHQYVHSFSLSTVLLTLSNPQTPLTHDLYISIHLSKPLITILQELFSTLTMKKKSYIGDVSTYMHHHVGTPMQEQGTFPCIHELVRKFLMLIVA